MIEHFIGRSSRCATVLHILLIVESPVAFGPPARSPVHSQGMRSTLWSLNHLSLLPLERFSWRSHHRACSRVAKPCSARNLQGLSDWRRFAVSTVMRSYTCVNTHSLPKIDSSRNQTLYAIHVVHTRTYGAELILAVVRLPARRI